MCVCVCVCVCVSHTRPATTVTHTPSYHHVYNSRDLLSKICDVAVTRRLQYWEIATATLGSILNGHTGLFAIDEPDHDSSVASNWFRGFQGVGGVEHRGGRGGAVDEPEDYPPQPTSFGCHFDGRSPDDICTCVCV